MHPRLAGRFINLDRCPDRAQAMQAQLARLGMGWVTRHAATDGAECTLPAATQLLPGEVACFLSHLRVLEQAAPDGFTLVLEDDAELSPQLPELLDTIVAGPFADHDIGFLECQPHYALPHLSILWDTAAKLLETTEASGLQRRAAGVELLDARSIYKYGTMAFVVSPAGRAKLLALIPQWLRQGPLLPLDRCIEQALVDHQLRGFVTVPFLATTGLRWHGLSGIGAGARTPPDLLMLLRRLLYAGSIAEVQGMAASLDARPADPALRMFGTVLREIARVRRDEVIVQRPGRRA